MDVDRLYIASRGESWWVRLLLPILAFLWLGELAAPISQLVQSSYSLWSVALALAGTAAFVGVYILVMVEAVRLRTGARVAPDVDVRTWLPSVVMGALAVLLCLSLGPAWLGLFIFTAVASGLRLAPRYAALTIATLIVLAGGIGLLGGDSLTDLAQTALLIGGIGASVATVNYAIRLTRELRAARAEVARLAVSDERLRFARDLHDLLGHSLSLVALKCDLAEQLIVSAPERARQEIQQAASVTRDALREVRETVAGYRRPTLAGELAGAQEMLAAAGIGYRLDEQPPELPSEAEDTLAWVVREGVTNVIRHSRARRCVIRFTERDATVEVEVIDDGARTRAEPQQGTGAGNGLRGLAERMSVAGGTCEAGPLRAGGFCLKASLPIQREPSPDDGSIVGSGRHT
jgi:two-component system sensor histidine kinase DesK